MVLTLATEVALAISKASELFLLLLFVYKCLVLSVAIRLAISRATEPTQNRKLKY